MPLCKNLRKIEIISINNNIPLASKVEGLSNLEDVDFSYCLKVSDIDATNLLMNNPYLKILRLNWCPLTDNFLRSIVENKNKLLLLSINKTDRITDGAIKDTEEKMKPNLRIIRACNKTWNKMDYGLRIPYKSDTYVKPQIKGAKKPPAKKNDDKSPENQLIKLREEMKPKMIYEYFLPEPKKTGKKGKKK